MIKQLAERAKMAELTQEELMKNYGYVGILKEPYLIDKIYGVFKDRSTK